MISRKQRATCDRPPAPNSTFTIDGVSCFADSFVVIEGAVRRINICVKKPAIANLPTRLANFRNTY